MFFCCFPASRSRTSPPLERIRSLGVATGSQSGVHGLYEVGWPLRQGGATTFSSPPGLGTCRSPVRDIQCATSTRGKTTGGPPGSFQPLRQFPQELANEPFVEKCAWLVRTRRKRQKQDAKSQTCPGRTLRFGNAVSADFRRSQPQGLFSTACQDHGAKF